MIRLLSTIAVLFWANHAFANTLKVKQIAENTNIPSAYVLDIEQLSNGYLLISTDAGARLFDGYQFLPVIPNDAKSPSPLESRVFDSFEDSQGTIWFATDRGLYRLTAGTSKLEKIDHQANSWTENLNENVRTIIEDKHGNLWFGTLKGVSKYNPVDQSYRHYSQLSNKESDRPYYGRIFKLFEEPCKYMWVGTSQGLFRIDLKTDEFERASGLVGNAYVTSAIFKSDNEIWFGSDINGIFSLNTQTRKVSNLRKESFTEFELKSNNIWSMYKDQNNNVWIGYWSQGVSAFNFNNGKSYSIATIPNDINALPGNSVEHITSDDSGLIWIATNGGAAIFDPATFNIESLIHQTDAPDTLNSSSTLAIAKQDEKNIWIGSEMGLQHWDPTNNKVTQLTDLKTTGGKAIGTVWRVNLIDKNHLLLASDIGMVRFNTETKEVHHFDQLQARNNKDLEVAFYAVVPADNGWFYVASSASTVHKLDPQTGENELVFDSNDSPQTIEMEYITRLLYAKDKTLWIGSTTGIYQIDQKNRLANKFNTNDGLFRLSGNLVYDLHESTDNSIWVATSTSGIDRIHRQGDRIEKFSFISTKDGLPSNQIYNLMSVDDKFVWFSSQKTIGKINTETQKITTYPVIGSYDRVFVEGSRLVDDKNNFYIGGSELIRFNPADLEQTSYSPLIKFTAISRMHQSVTDFEPLNQNFTFNVFPEDSLVTIHFASLDYANAAENRFRYRLSGYNKNWLSPGTEPKASFTHLSPGKYQLQVQGTNRDGLWSDKTATMQIVVHPPIWRTWYAYLGYFLIVFGLISWIVNRKREARKLEIQSMESIKESEARLRDVLWGSGDVLWRWDLRNDQLISTDNAKMRNSTREEESNFKDFMSLVHPNDQALVQEMIDRHISGEQNYYEAQFRLLDQNTQDWQWVMSRGRIIERDENNNPIILAGTRKNIEDLKKTEKQLRFLANYDQLTRLPNRSLFQEHLMHAIAMAKRFDEKIAVLFFDLDGFKIINDSLGHAVGDQLLQAVGLRLTNVLRTTDSCARLGGDEFAVILERLNDKEDTVPTLRRLLEEVSRPFNLNDQTVTTSISVGVSVFPDHGTDPSSLLKHADIAMYEAKRAGKKTYRFYDSDMNAALVKRLEISNELKQAIIANQFETHYQPRVSVETNQVSGFEALIRWRHPERGLVSPAEFIPIAEETGQILELGDWILQDACRQGAAWYAQGWRGFISVNIAALQFQQSDLVSTVENALNLSKLPAECLELEITEGTLIKDINRTRNIILRLKNLGVKIALDDFGTGYSSLSYLQQLPIDSLKIDRSFINQIPGSSKSARLCRAIINMAHSLDLHVIAEGIEENPQLDFLKEARCEEYQGYLFGKPVASSEIEI